MHRTPQTPVDHGTSMRTLRAGLVALTLVLASGGAHAQCVGDCSTDGTVTVNELIVGVNIALDTAALATCPVFDADSSGNVTVNELIAAVNNALGSCPVVPTPTASPTATISPTVQPTATAPAGCGDGVVDFTLGETCDDGNTRDGDSCPGTCRIASCTASGSRIAVDVSFTPPTGVDIGGITVFLRYPDGVVRIPGSANDQPVQDRVSNTPDNAFTTLNDLDYALRAVMFSTDEALFAPGLLLAVAFDTCQGASPPAADMFSCTVEDAADINREVVTGVTCAAVLH